jgi:hypothetical protein
MAKLVSKPKLFFNYKTLVVQIIALCIALFALLSNEWLTVKGFVSFYNKLVIFLP